MVAFDHGTLIVMFNDLDIYEYKEVPEQVFKDIMTDDSIGRAYNKLVRRKYLGSGPFKAKLT